MVWYAKELLGQIPCMRMMDHSGRKRLYNDPGLKGIIYHTVKFCDFYSFEYAQIKQNVTVPLLKIESDYTVQSSGQLLTRLEAFAESMNMEELEGKELKMGKGYFAGIDSGSTSTDVVILDKDQKYRDRYHPADRCGSSNRSRSCIGRSTEGCGTSERRHRCNGYNRIRKNGHF